MNDATFTPPTQEDTERLARQWLSISNLTQEEFGQPLTQSVEDLVLIQRLLDEDIVDRGTHALQSLGVALGRVMARTIPGLDWWIITDQYGTDPCLRFMKTTLQVNPLTMISKRIERGDVVDVRDLYDKTVTHVSKLREQVD